MLSINNNRKGINISKISLKKEQIIRPISIINRINKFNENIKNISFTFNKKIDNSYNYRTSTVNTENNERLKTNYETVLTNPSLNNKKHIKNKIKDSFKKNLFYNKKIFRPKTTSNRLISKQNINKEKKLNILFKNYNKNKLKDKYNGVPLSFVESMRLNLKQNIIKADNFFENEKRRLIKINPDYRYQLIHNETQIKKKQELARINKIKLLQKFLKNKGNKYNGNIINNYYSNLLLKDNNQFFNNPIPIIDKKKFDSKYRLLTEQNDKSNNIQEEINYKECVDIRKIFSNVLDLDIGDKNKKIVKVREIKIKTNIYKLIKLCIKKCAIEFKNIIIPLKEYITYYYLSKNTVDNLFSENYSTLIKMIKISKEEKKIIEYITNDKILIFSVNIYRQNLIILAVKHKLYKTMAKLIQFGGNINLQDFKGRTALHFAVTYNDLTAVIILLYFLANPSIKDSNGETPIDIAFNSKQDNYMIKELLIRSKIIIKINKYRGWKDYAVCIRRGIQYYLIHNLLKEEYLLIFSYIDNAILYYS